MILRLPLNDTPFLPTNIVTHVQEDPTSSTSLLAYTYLELEPNPDHELGNDNFDPNSIVVEILSAMISIQWQGL